MHTHVASSPGSLILSTYPPTFQRATLKIWEWGLGMRLYSCIGCVYVCVRVCVYVCCVCACVLELVMNMYVVVVNNVAMNE